MDHAATTPVRPEVLDAMMPYFGEYYGNPSSLHNIGRRASSALDQARRAIASLINARESEIIFTGCGTESDNLALRGIAQACRNRTGVNRIITSAVEHHAVLHLVEGMAANEGFALDLLPVDQDGMVPLSTVENSLGDGSDVAIVSVMMANNEIGTIQPIAEIGRLCQARDVPFHTDAIQAAGKILLDVETLHVDALSVSAHKFSGPKGVGLLYLRNGTPFQPQMLGGSHERSRRAGTENVPSIVGMARAFELAESERNAESARQRVLRDKLIGVILETVDSVRLTGSPSERLDNLASFVIEGVEAEGILIALDLAGVAASSGSACTSGSQRPSHVLEAIGVPLQDAAGGLRLSLGRSNRPADVDYILEILPAIVKQMRNTVPVAF